MATIIYILGIILDIWCVLDILKAKKVGLIGKIIIAVLTLALSWVGFCVYYFIVREKIK